MSEPPEAFEPYAVRDPDETTPSSPGLAPAATRDTQGRLHNVLEAFKDNIEAFTVALVMALVIKHFCIEAFKIPTGSMMPTLYGEKNSPQGIGDRILVDKWAYLVSGPERWDVIVFRYPLNQSKHFIKRVAGLSGEQIRTVRGDLWVRSSDEGPWRIATKRRRVRDELYLPVYPPEPPPETGYGSAEAMPDPPDYWDVESGWEVVDFRRLRFGGGPPAAAEFRKRIGRLTDVRSYEMTGDTELIRDARFSVTLTPESGTTVWLRWWLSEDVVAELQLASEGASEGSYVRSADGDVEKVQRVAARLAPGRATDVELECVDGQVYVLIDGEERAHIDEGHEIDDPRRVDDQRFELAGSGGAFEVSSIRIQRDVHYGPKSMWALGRHGDGVQVPEGHYFMLGDNTESSSDSRQWILKGVILKDGTEIWYEADGKDNSPHLRDDGFMHVVDREGIERKWRSADVEKSTSKDLPFVSRDLVVGRAFFIFWPLLPKFPGRAGLIH